MPTVEGVLETVADVRAPRDLAISLVHSEPEAREVVATLGRIWSRDDGKEPLPPELAWVFAHSGNYVAIARSGSEPIAAAIGFRGDDDEGPHLHSHIAGVLPQWQGSNVGYALKQHQRSWALERSLDRITWTFDPLVARNAYFNVVKLGAQLTRYYVDFYGRMDDGINDGDETDRCLATWRLTGERAAAAASGVFTPADIAAQQAAGAAQILIDDNGSPRVDTITGDVRLVQLPADIVAMRQAAPAKAHQWRLAVREVLTRSFDEGLEIVGVSRSACYVLARRSS